MKGISLKKQSRLRKTLLIIVVLAAIIFLLNSFPHSVRNFFYKFSAPIQAPLLSAGNGFFNFLGSLFEGNDLKKENDVLKTENQNLLSQLATLNDLKKENDSLRSALDIGLEKEFKLISTQIVGKDIPGEIILINKGSDSGISKDMPLVNSQKVLFGKVIEVYDNFSKVMLVSDKNNSLDGLILSKDTTGLVKGQGSGKLLFDLIPNDKNIAENDVIVTNGMDGVFPKNLLVGKIVKVLKSDLEPIQRADIEPFFSLNNVNILFLISKQ